MTEPPCWPVAPKTVSSLLMVVGDLEYRNRYSVSIDRFPQTSFKIYHGELATLCCSEMFLDLSASCAREQIVHALQFGKGNAIGHRLGSMIELEAIWDY